MSRVACRFGMLKSFCEGHFSQGQLFLGQSLGSSNVINLSTQLLCALANAHSSLAGACTHACATRSSPGPIAESVQLSALDFLVESIQGPCLANCEVALNSRIAAAFNMYVRTEPYSFENPVLPSDISMSRLEKFCVFFQVALPLPA